LLKNIQEADGIIELIYAYEPLAYFFSIKPLEYWDMSFRDIYMYCEAQSLRKTEEMRKEIQVQEAMTNKLIGASIVQKHPKVVSLMSMFEGLFPKEEEKVQSVEEQLRILRGIMSAEANG